MLRSLRRHRVLVALCLLATSAAVLVGGVRAFHLPLLPLAAGILAGLVVALLVDRRRQGTRTRPRAPRPVRVLPGGRVLGRRYDLRRDRTTDDQRWLM